MSTLLFKTLLCWYMFALSQEVDNTFSSCPAMSRLAVILSMLAVSRVAELSRKGVFRNVALSHLQSSAL